MVRIGINDKYLKLMGLEAIRIVRERTLQGKDKQGKPFKPYSTNTFAMPRAAMTSKPYLTLKDGGQLAFFKSEGLLWVVVMGGYKAYKAAKRPGDSGKVNLTDTGQMLRALTVKSATGTKITIGFSTESESQKMLWNIEKGRDPMGLTDAELERMIDKFSKNEDFWVLEVG